LEFLPIGRFFLLHSVQDWLISKVLSFAEVRDERQMRRFKLEATVAAALARDAQMGRLK
jgi:hypothetical protein